MLTLIFSIILSYSAQAQVRFAPVEGEFQGRAEFQYLTTTANYTDGGSSAALNAGGKLTRMLGAGEVTYDYSPALRFWGGISGGQSTAVVVDSANSFFTPVTKTVAASGISEGWLGGQWWTEFKMFDIVPQVDFVIPFSRVNMNSADPLLGEGAMRFQGGAWATYPADKITPFVYLGLAYRDEGRSMLLPYSLGARFGESSKWWIQAEFRGYQSVNSDSNSGNRTARDAYLGYCCGGSYEFYSLNPSRNEIAGMIGVRFDQLEVYGGGSKTVFGRNSADDYQFQVGVTFHYMAFGKQKGVAAPVPPADAGFQEDGFQENGVKYDEKLFEEEVTPKPMTAPPPEQPKARVKKKAPPPKEVPMPNVELLMKDTQKTLEKRKGR